MHEGEMVMQSGENSAVLVVCVCVAFFFFLKHTHGVFWTKLKIIIPFHFE